MSNVLPGVPTQFKIIISCETVKIPPQQLVDFILQNISWSANFTRLVQIRGIAVDAGQKEKDMILRLPQ